MSTSLLFFGIDIATIAVLCFVLVFSLGVVWRVEKKLDLSYKFFTAAAVAFALAEIAGFYAGFDTETGALLSKGLRLLGAVFFLASILLMRSIVRTLDHERE